MSINILKLNEVAKTYFNQSHKIKKSLITPYYNGIIESFNNKRKNSFQFSKLKNFRTKILLLD